MSNQSKMIYATYPNLADKRVVVTGGGTGIGAELVTAFVQQGAKVTVLDIATEASQELAAKLSEGA
jgi:NAD(P)-dependent dehydrogenase (short-subunit alcohol dehydrogenase family)